MKYLHTGIPVARKMDGMTYAAPLKVWIKLEPTYATEFLYFEPDSPMAGLIQNRAHVAYEVPDIDSAIEGKSLLLPKFDLGNAYIAFIWDKETVVEFYQNK